MERKWKGHYPLVFCFSNVLPKFCQVLNEFAAAEPSLPCKRLADGSKRVQLPQFLKQQVKRYAFCPAIFAGICLINPVFLSAIGGRQIDWIEPYPVHCPSWFIITSLEPVNRALYTPNYGNHAPHNIINSLYTFCIASEHVALVV